MVNDEGRSAGRSGNGSESQPQSMTDYRNGKEKASPNSGGLTHSMRAMKGKADPALVNHLVQGTAGGCGIAAAQGNTGGRSRPGDSIPGVPVPKASPQASPLPTINIANS